MEFDIWNNESRKVVCTRNGDDDSLVANTYNHLLEVGKTYTVEDVEIHSWHTIVYLKEFPGKTFNSVLFNEITI